jgi:aminopeptidase N
MHAVYRHSDQWRHDSGPVAHPIDADHLFDVQGYHGGALVLYALRQVVGARTFERVGRARVARHRDRVATTPPALAKRAHSPRARGVEPP